MKGNRRENYPSSSHSRSTGLSLSFTSLNVVHVLYVLCDSVHFRLYMGEIPINTEIRTGLIFENISEA